MSLPKFEYLAPKTVAEACSLLSQYKEKAKVIAGGTDLLVQMKERTITPQYLIGLNGIANLDYIEHSEARLRIGALASLNSIAGSPLVREKFALLADAMSTIGTIQVRNRGTIGGNLCNAAPSADSAPPLIILGAQVKVVGEQGERVIPLEGFFTGPGETTLQAGEILTEVQIPDIPPNTGGTYLKLFARSAIDIAAVGVAALLTAKDGTCSDAKIALGAVAPTPIRAKEAEKSIIGKKIEKDLIEKVAELASEESRPISDIRSSAEYRREMVKVLTRRAITQAWERAKGG